MHFLNPFAFKKKKNHLNDHSPLSKFFDHFTIAKNFFDFHFKISLSPTDFELSLTRVAQKYGFGTGSILFAKIFEHSWEKQIKKISPLILIEEIKQKETFLLLDIRESWEKKITSLQIPLLKEVSIDNLKNSFEKSERIVVLDHFGVKSLDACYELTNAGFTNALALEGGIHRWSIEVDPSIPQYEGPAC